MAVEGCLMVLETILYFALFLSGLVSAITVGISRTAYNGDCVLYAEVQFCNGTEFYYTDLGSNGVCGFSIALDVIAAFYALACGAYYVSIFLKWLKERRWILLPTIIINASCLVLVFIDSCILSIGFKRFCGSLTSLPSTLTDCSAATSALNWNRATTCAAGGTKLPVEHGSYDGGKFYGFLTTAQGASWFSVLFLVIILGCSIVRRIRDKPTLDPNSDKAPITDVDI